MNWKYLKSLLRHKWFVFLECRKLGITWLGIIHDLSKFKPSEWKPYTKMFYGVKGAKGSALEEFKERKFNEAWLHHQKRNKHHWQYWLLVEDDDLTPVDGLKTIRPLAMPLKYVKEMLADWVGASIAYTGNDNTKEWYMGRREGFRKVLHPSTRFWIEKQLGVE